MPIVLYLCVVWFDRWVFPQLRVCVLIVNIVPNADELLSTISAGDQNHSNAYCITLWYQSRIWSICL